MSSAGEGGCMGSLLLWADDSCSPSVERSIPGCQSSYSALAILTTSTETYWTQEKNFWSNVTHWFPSVTGCSFSFASELGCVGKYRVLLEGIIKPLLRGKYHPPPWTSLTPRCWRCWWEFEVPDTSALLRFLCIWIVSFLTIKKPTGPGDAFNPQSLCT